MVEYKNSVYDEQPQEPPLVPAVPAPGDDVTPSAPPEQEVAEESSEKENDNNNKAVASGTAGAVLGLLFGGPIGAALLGFGAAYAVRKEKGDTVGDAARALGDVAISTKNKAKELDEQHRIVERSQQAATTAWESAKVYDQKYNVLDQVREAIVISWAWFVDVVTEHKLLERGVEGVGRGYEYVADRVGNCGSDEKNETTLQQQQQQPTAST